MEIFCNKSAINFNHSQRRGSFTYCFIVLNKGLRFLGKIKTSADKCKDSSEWWEKKRKSGVNSMRERKIFRGGEEMEVKERIHNYKEARPGNKWQGRKKAQKEKY